MSISILASLLLPPVYAAPPASPDPEGAAVEAPRPQDPAPPPGFSWVGVPEARASFLRPDGWFLKKQTANGTTALFITKEEIGPDGKRFSTGMTINIIQNLPARAKTTPSAFAAQAHASARSKSKLVDEVTSTTGAFRFLAYTSVDPAPPPVTVRNVFIANDKTGTLYWLILEAPEVDWPRVNEAFGSMLERMSLDDEV